MMNFWSHNARSKWNTIGNKFMANSDEENESYDFVDCEIDTASTPTTPTPTSPQVDDIIILDLYAAALALNSDGESRPQSSNSNRSNEASSDSQSIVSIDMNNNPKRNLQILASTNPRINSGFPPRNRRNSIQNRDLERTKPTIGKKRKNDENRRDFVEKYDENVSKDCTTKDNLYAFGKAIPGLARRRISNTSEHTLFTVASLTDATVIRLANSRRSSLVNATNHIYHSSSSFSDNGNGDHAKVNNRNNHSQRTKPIVDKSINSSKSSFNSKKFTNPKEYSISNSSLYSSKLYPNKLNRERRRSFGQQSRVAGVCNSLTCAAATLFSMTLSTLVLGALAALLVFQNDVLAQSSDPPKVCQTDACRKAGLALYESINFTVNPCDDFFEYACGRWVAKNPIPDDKSRVGTFSSLSELVNADLRDVLNDAASAKQKNPNAYPTKALNYAIDTYSECLDRDTIKALGDQPIIDLVQKTLNFDWPLISGQDFDKVNFAGKSKLDTFKETWLRLYHIGQAPVFTFVVTPDANNTKVRVFDFDHPGFTLGRKEYKNPESYVDQIKYYREFTKNVATFMAGNRLNDANRDELDARLQEIFNFEQKLALASTPEEERRSASVWYNRMSFDNLESLTDNRFDWKNLVNQFLKEIDAGYVINGDTILILDDIPYYKKLYAILQETPSHVLHNYVGYILTRDYIKYTEGNLKKIAFEYSQKLHGVQKESPLWQRCVSQVFGDYSFALSRLYVDKYVSSSTKVVATSMIQDLKNAFRDIVQKRTWLDETTRQKALEKLDGIRENVAYPDWLMNNTELDNKYGLDGDIVIPYTKGQYMRNALQNNIFSMSVMYKRYLEPVDIEKGWPMAPALVNAAYMPTQNSITIPVGILRPPFFDAGRPNSMNYGAIGAVIGHEITHGFDDQGAQFDKIGNLVNWWTKETEKNFADGSKCFVDQYGSIIDKQTNKKLNGVNTQGENIADNGGVRQAFNAFQSYSKRNSVISKVPYMENFTHEQMFFLGYASVWCGRGRDQYVRSQIDYDAHSPVRYRVNTVLQNIPSFSQAFQCNVGTNMNPTEQQVKRCTLW